MALNRRQIDFLTRLKAFAEKMESLYGEAHALKEAFAEEFDDAQDNSLLNENEDLEIGYFFESTDVKTAIFLIFGLVMQLQHRNTESICVE